MAAIPSPTPEDCVAIARMVYRPAEPMAREQRVSIVLPLFKSEPYLRSTLESVFAQTYPHWELVVVNDGSPDRSAQICRDIGDERIRVFDRTNTGPCRSRNFGLTQIAGELVAFIDHDDLWRPTKLEKQIAHLAARPEVGVSYGPSEMIDADGRPLGLLQVPKLTDIDAREIICRCPVGNGSVPLIRREVLEETKFYADVDGQREAMYFDEEARGWEDVELWFRIAVQTDWKFEGIPDCLTQYRIVPDGVAGNPERKQRGFEKGLERARLYAPEYVAKYEAAARAYHLRYLARRLIHAGDGARAREYVNRALMSFPGVLTEEFTRTASTVGAAYLMSALPKPVFSRLKDYAVKRTREQQDKQVRD